MSEFPSDEFPNIDVIDFDGSDESSGAMVAALRELLGEAADPEDDGRAPKPAPDNPVQSSKNFMTWAKSGGIGQGLGLNAVVVGFAGDDGVYLSDINGTLFEVRAVSEVPSLDRPSDLPELGQKILVTDVPDEFLAVHQELPVVGWVTVPMLSPEQALKEFGTQVAAYVKLDNGLKGVVPVRSFDLVLEGEVVPAPAES